MSEHPIYAEARKIGVDLHKCISGSKIIAPSEEELKKYNLTKKEWLKERLKYVREQKKLRDAGTIPSKPETKNKNANEEKSENKSTSKRKRSKLSEVENGFEDLELTMEIHEDNITSEIKDLQWYIKDVQEEIEDVKNQMMIMEKDNKKIVKLLENIVDLLLR